MTYYLKGAWNAICDRCGFQFKSTQLKKEWTGHYVCQDCWEPRHPQDFVKGVKDDSSIEWARPDPAVSETDTSGWADTKTSVPDGTFDNEI